MAKRIELFLVNPRGFCAGVRRAIEIVDRMLKIHGAPLYVKHEIVHNKNVIADFKKKGVIFVNEIDEVPLGGRVIFSAHGVSQKVINDAKERNLSMMDATCPLVKNVHQTVKNFDKQKRKVILIGHRDHPEVLGTRGQIENEIIVVKDVKDIEQLNLDKNCPVSYVTQTTINIDDVQNVIQALQRKFVDIKGPKIGNVCYATKNRQDAVKAIANNIDLLIVIGSQNSSNANRLRDLGCNHSYLIDDVSGLDLSWFWHGQKVGLTAGASTPEYLVEGIVNYLKENFEVSLSNIKGLEEDIVFSLPSELRK